MNGNVTEESGEAPPLPQAAELSVNGSTVKHPLPNGDDCDPDQPQEMMNGMAADLHAYSIDDDDNAPEAAAVEEETGSSPYYSPSTVAAISSLINNESPLFHLAPDGNSTESTLATSNRQTKNYELTVSDRATAIISVYRDYLHEEARADRQADQQQSTDFAAPPSNQPLLLREDDGQLLLLDGDLNNIQIDRSAYVQGGQDSLPLVVTPHDLRKEEIKLAALEKFCSENSTTSSNSNSKDKKHKKRKKRKRDAARKHKDSESKSSSSAYSSVTGSWDEFHTRKKDTQTAASTTAAFRLKADVALRTVSSATAHMVQRATVATRTTARVMKARYRDSTVNIKDIREREEICNDYDFKSYNPDDYCGDGGLSPPSTRYPDEEYNVEDMEYGISPLGDKGLVFRRDDDDDDGEISMAASFRDICNDLGVTSATHPNLDKYDRDRRRSYKYPIFRSKKLRKAVCYGSVVLLIGVVAVSIASAITNGFEEARRRRSPPLPDYTHDEEWRERQKLEWEEEHGEKYTGYNNVAVVVPDAANLNGVEDVMPPPPMSKKDKTFQAVSAAYRPVWFDRSTGWKGQTYQASLDFCAKYSDYIPCPYEVYCPMDKTLLSGVMDHNGESWAAVINMNNEWVQVGTEGECDLYSEKYKKAPEWGLDGQNNEMITRHIMCCRRHPYEEGSVWDVPNEPGSGGNDYVHKPITSSSTGDDSSGAVDNVSDNSDVTEDAEDNSVAQDNAGSENTVPAVVETSTMTEWETQIQNAHHPAWFSNELGWQGTTHLDAQAFCKSIPHGAGTLELCPLQAYCPNGPKNDKPLYLQMDAYEGEQWAPIESSSPNEWVMVGMLNKDPSSTCRTYLQLHHKPPTFGVDGSKVDIKKHILCCERVNSESGGNAVIKDEGLAVTDNALTEMVVGIQSNSDNTADSASSEETPDKDTDSGNGALTDMVIGIQSENNDSNSGSIAASGSETSSSSSNNGDEKINSIYATFDPIWLDYSFGWDGGSHDDAVQVSGIIA
eukprot:CCRYP_019595-RA/>CCRYP_019595-RA protein AED:0.00 eAED:0.00 QI:103/1/1/1/1/1/2/486/1007